MPLSNTRLKNALKPVIESQMRAFLVLGIVPYPQLTNFAEAMATAIANEVVSEINANAVSRIVVNQAFTGTVSGASCSTAINQTFNGTVL